MTKTLYLEDSMLTSFTATVMSCEPYKKQFKIILDQTAFYPEGGGQPADKGVLNDIPVTYVMKKDGEIYHLADSPLDLGTQVKGKIDWDRRKDLMQQHAGEHLLSGAVFKLYNAKNVGFHLTEDNLTVDLDKDLSLDDILKAETLVNEWIQDDRSIRAEYPSEEVIKTLPLRKDPTVSKNIRVVTMDDADCVACGAPHPNSTAILGLLKVKKIERYKGGSRVTFVVGNRALSDYREKTTLTNTLVNLLKAQPDKILEKVTKLMEENQQLAREKNALLSELSSIEAKSLTSDAVEHKDGYKIIRKVFSNKDFGAIREMALKLCETDDTVVLFGLKDTDASRLVYSRSKNLQALSMRDLFSPAISKLDGRGGGNAESAQGGGKYPEKLEIVLQESMDTLLGV